MHIFFLKEPIISKGNILNQKSNKLNILRSGFKTCYLILLCILFTSTAIVHAQVKNTSSVNIRSSFKGWVSDLRKATSDFHSSQHIWIEDLGKDALLISVYPKQLDVDILNWVGKGGKLFVALNRDSIPGAETFLKALDLKVNTPKSSSSSPSLDVQIKGAWPFPKQSTQNPQFTNYLLTPWLTIDPVSFQEGNSWYKGSIPPIAIDEYGHSIAYRVRYGKGILTLFGDADALSDQLSILSENRRFAQAILWWITHPYPAKLKPSSPVETTSQIKINFIPPRGKIMSRLNEERLSHRLHEFYKQAKQWWNDHPIWDFNMYTHIKYLVISLCLAYIIILLWLNESPSWRSLFILRKK